MGAGAVTLWHSRKLDRKAWRYGRRALIGIAGSLVALQVVGGAALGYYATHRPESAVGEPSLGVAHEDVTLTTSDGLELEGWYVPSRNRAAVLVFPGRSGNKQHHARNLIGHGYGVLLVDNRGQGESEGDPNSFGWDDETDVNAALDFLTDRSRRGCQPHWGARPLSGRRDAARDRSAYRSPSGGRVRGRGWEDLEGGPRDASPDPLVRPAVLRDGERDDVPLLEHAPARQPEGPREGHPPAPRVPDPRQGGGR